jgi:hypothetical protein
MASGPAILTTKVFLYRGISYAAESIRPSAFIQIVPMPPFFPITLLIRLAWQFIKDISR